MGHVSVSAAPSCTAADLYRSDEDSGTWNSGHSGGCPSSASHQGAGQRDSQVRGFLVSSSSSQAVVRKLEVTFGQYVHKSMFCSLYSLLCPVILQLNFVRRLMYGAVE